MIDRLGDQPSTLAVPASPPRPALASLSIPPAPQSSAPRVPVALGLGAGGSLGLLPSLTPFAVLRGELGPFGLPPVSLAMRAHGASEAQFDGAGGSFNRGPPKSAAAPPSGGALRAGL
jgi:hypothetical protein